METKKPNNPELISQLNEKLAKELNEMRQVTEELPKIMGDAVGLFGKFFDPKEKKNTVINNGKAEMVLLKNGGLIIIFEDKQKGEDFYNGH